MFDLCTAKHLSQTEHWCSRAHVFVNLWTTRVFEEPLCAQAAQIYWLLEEFVWRPSPPPHLSVKVSVKKELLPDSESHALPHAHSGPAPRSVSLRWFWPWMISALCARRWSVISPLWSPPHLPHLRSSIVKSWGPLGAVNQAVEGRASPSREWTHTPRKPSGWAHPTYSNVGIKARKATISLHYHVTNNVAAPPQAGLQGIYICPLRLDYWKYNISAKWSTPWSHKYRQI